MNHLMLPGTVVLATMVAVVLTGCETYTYGPPITGRQATGYSESRMFLTDYKVTDSSDVSLVVFNHLGEVIDTLLDECHPPGLYEVRLDATGYMTGVYFYRLEIGGERTTGKFAIVK